MTPPIRALLIDLSGTLHIGFTPTANAVSALARLRASKIPFRFCTNTSKESTSALCKRLEGMGFYVKTEEVWSSIGALKGMLSEKGVMRPYFLLEDDVRNECLDGLIDDQKLPYDSVVVGLAPSLFTYDIMNTAFRILTGEQPSPTSNIPSKKPTLIATHKAKYIRSPDGHLSLGPGPFVTALENASGVRAVVVGKPGRPFFENVIRSLQLSSGSEGGRIAVIGDDIESDLGEGAVELGMWRILVRTGKYRQGDESKNGVVPPNETVDSFAVWVDHYLRNFT